MRHINRRIEGVQVSSHEQTQFLSLGTTDSLNEGFLLVGDYVLHHRKYHWLKNPYCHLSVSETSKITSD